MVARKNCNKKAALVTFAKRGFVSILAQKENIQLCLNNK